LRVSLPSPELLNRLVARIIRAFILLIAGGYLRYQPGSAAGIGTLGCLGTHIVGVQGATGGKSRHIVGG
jgi:hypothetical protein